MLRLETTSYRDETERLFGFGGVSGLTGRSWVMRKTFAFVGAILAMGFFGCGEKANTPQSQQAVPEMAEAQTHFTFKGKPIPPFFLADLLGGPQANDLWMREMGCRVCSVAVEGLFIEPDGTYANCQIKSSADGSVSFDLPSDESSGPRGAGWAGYKFVGTAPSGVSVLEYSVNTGGSGTVIGVVFLRVETESVGYIKGDKKDRLVLRFLGALDWGDRVFRDIKLEGNELRLGPERSHMPGAQDSLEPARTILLE